MWWHNGVGCDAIIITTILLTFHQPSSTLIPIAIGKIGSILLLSSQGKEGRKEGRKERQTTTSVESWLSTRHWMAEEKSHVVINSPYPLAGH